MSDVAFPTLAVPFRETVTELRAECATLELFAGDLGDELDRLRRELEAKARQLDARATELNEQESQLTLIEAHLAAKESQLAGDDEQGPHRELTEQKSRAAAALAELAELKAEANRERHQAAQREAELFAQIKSLTETWNRERDELKVEVDRLREDRESLRQQLERSQVKFAELTTAGDPTELAEHVAALEAERLALNAELSLARGRAAELYETVAEQKQSLTEDRARMVRELKRLRRLAEQQSLLLAADRGHPVKPTRTETADEKPRPRDKDPVLDSVMAQFAKLQGGERRKPGKRT